MDRNADSFDQGTRLCLVGLPEFGRRFSAETQRMTAVQAFHVDPLAAWSNIISYRPNALCVEISVHHRDRDLTRTRALLERVRERFGSEIYVIVALMAPERLRHGGELLFASQGASENQSTLEPSLLVDAFIASPPSLIPNILPIGEQLRNVLELLQAERTRRLRGLPPLPPLGAPGWAQSMADPKSRELWMRWLPRYAVYANENPIVIGETGSGKTNFAYALHLLSGRRGDFIAVTPRDFSSTELVQAELFGAVAGAYTGAVEKWGLVKGAEKGTLFVDELQSIDKDLQGKIITFIEDKTYRRVGSAERIEADVRFVFASNMSLQQMLSADILRHDFAYRLERVQLEIPPLRERRLDIAAALGYALSKVLRQRPYTVMIEGCTSDAYRLLFSHRWPGNLRQLENTVAQLCELSDMRGEAIISDATVREVFESRVHSLAPQISDIISQAAYRLASTAVDERVESMDQGMTLLRTITQQISLEFTGGDYQAAARLLHEDPQLLEWIAHRGQVDARNG